MATKAQKIAQANKALLIEALTKLGFKPDRYGNYKAHSHHLQSPVRVKFQANSVRFERDVEFPGQKLWQLISSCFLKDLKFTADSAFIGNIPLNDNYKFTTTK